VQIGQMRLEERDMLSAQPYPGQLNIKI